MNTETTSFYDSYSSQNRNPFHYADTSCARCTLCVSEYGGDAPRTEHVYIKETAKGDILVCRNHAKLVR